PADERPRLAEQSAQFSEEDLTRFFNILLATDEDLRRKPDTRLHLELGLLKLVNAQRLAPLEEVLAELRGEVRAGPRPARPTGPSSETAPAEAPRSLPARAVPIAPVPASPPRTVARAAEDSTSGLASAQVEAIK